MTWLRLGALALQFVSAQKMSLDVPSILSFGSSPSFASGTMCETIHEVVASSKYELGYVCAMHISIMDLIL